MSDPQPAKLKKTPPRAEPLQPDRPGRDDETQADDSATGGGADDIGDRQRSENAVKNVSEGYD